MGVLPSFFSCHSPQLYGSLRTNNLTRASIPAAIGGVRRVGIVFKTLSQKMACSLEENKLGKKISCTSRGTYLIILPAFSISCLANAAAHL